MHQRRKIEDCDEYQDEDGFIEDKEIDFTQLHLRGKIKILDEKDSL